MRRSLALLAGSALLLTGCGGTPEVSTDDLEQQITDRLTEQVGKAPDEVACPDPLPAEEGADARCALTAGEEEYGVTVTTTEVDGDNVRFDIKVDDKPSG